MAEYKSFQQVHQSLTCSLCASARGVRGAYELWMAAAVDLPQHMLPPAAVEANDLISAALQAAPAGITRSEHEEQAWLQEHLPDISTAMTDALSSQLDTSTKRISILQALITSKQGSKDGQLSARLEAERDTHLLLETQVWVYSFVQLVAVLAMALLFVKTDAGGQDGGGAHQHSRRQRLQHGLKKGRELVDITTEGLHHAFKTVAPLQKLIYRAKACLHSLRIRTIDPSVDQGRLMTWLRAHGTGHEASLWLCDLAKEFPSTLLSTCLLAHAMGLTMFAYETVEHNFMLACVRTFLCHILADPELCVQVCAASSRGFMVSLIPAFEVRAKHLQQAGIPIASQGEALAAWGADVNCLEWTDSVNKHLLTSNDMYNIKHVIECGVQGVEGAVDGSKEGTGEAAGAGMGKDVEASAGVAAGDGPEDANDMQALLRLMYGCDVPKGAHC